jgi:hypothetical protein
MIYEIKLINLSHFKQEKLRIASFLMGGLGEREKFIEAVPQNWLDDQQPVNVGLL